MNQKRRQQAAGSRWPKLVAAVYAVVCGLSLAATAAADPDKPARSGQRSAKKLQHSGDRGADGKHLGYILLGASCVLGVGMVGMFLYIRRRRRRDVRRDRLAGAFGASTPARVHHLQESSAAESSSSSVTLPADTLVETHGGSEVGVLAGPTANRTSALATQKGVEPELIDDQGRLDSAQQGLDRRVCTGCDRRFAADVDFCYHDGLPLRQDSRQQAAEAPKFLVCKKCGWEGPADAQHTACPHDGHELVEFDPVPAAPVLPTMAMMVCPTCRRFSAPTTTTCPVDGDRLAPLVDVRMRDFPACGFGPRRKICAKCGTKHGPKAFYCHKDGSHLAMVN